MTPGAGVANDRNQKRLGSVPDDCACGKVAVRYEAIPMVDELPPGDDDAVPIVPIEDSIDLHGFQPRDIPSVVEEYLRAAAEQGFREVRLIHGRGTGFQRRRVREVLEQCPEVERFMDAPPARGGWGATLVWLAPGPRRA